MFATLRALVSSALVLSAFVGLAACAKNGRPPPLRVALVADESPLGDAALNQSAGAGIDAAHRLLGADVAILHARTIAEYRADLTLLADQDYDEVFGVGPATGGAMTQIARRYPRRNFALVGDTSVEPNVTSIVFPVQQGAFLAGVLAAEVAHGRSIEIEGGAGSPSAAALRSGFLAGLRQMGSSPATGAHPPPAGTAPAATLYGAPGAVAFETQPGPRLGAVLARVVERADVAVLLICADARSLKVPAGPTSFGIAQHGIELGLTAGGKRAAGPAGLARLAGVRAAIAAGQLSPPGSSAQLAGFKRVAL